MLETIILAIVQGLTEFLPVSSSGHLSVFQHFFNAEAENKLLISVVLHLGTLFAVFIAFRKTIFSLIKEFFSLVKDIFTAKFKWKEMNTERRMIVMIVISILPLFGFYIFKDYFTSFANDSSILAEGFFFIYTAIILLMTSKCMNGKKSAKNITTGNALTIGIFQGVALLPGVSRSGSTISAALFCNIKKETAVEYSFILGIPVILAGALVEILDASKAEVQIDILPLVVGFFVSAVSGFFAIKLVKWLIKTEKFKYFGYYTLVLGVGIIIYSIVK